MENNFSLDSDNSVPWETRIQLSPVSFKKITRRESRDAKTEMPA